ncbi:MAG: cytidylate kinase-like family protein [Desulfatitalea sp.]|nr:cytidylate kinase-like family protein [Desulfatitalea sp.]
MSIITISRGCYSHGKEIAEHVAAALGYECISREVVLEASRFFNIPETRLTWSIHHAPSLLERIIHPQAHQHYLDCIQAALLEHVKNDNVVYHGGAGHLFLTGIRHVLRVRVIAEMQDRVDLVCKMRKIPRTEAITLIEAEDRQREEWYHSVYKKDISDPRLYDMLLHIGRLTIDDAIELICATAARESFKPTARSMEDLNDRALLSHVKTVLTKLCEADVAVAGGVVTVKVKGQKLRDTGFTRPGMQQRVQTRMQEDLRQEITALVSKIPGVKDLICEIGSPYYA